MTSIASKNPLDYGWNWTTFQGGRRCLSWNRRDLQQLDQVMALVPQKRVVVQAGGNLGIFPKRLAQVFSTVYTFEPDAALFLLLAQNAPETNIVKLQAALGDTREVVGISRVRRAGRLPDHEGLAHISGTGIVPTLQIDDLGLPVCDLIYLDVEGYEVHALGGAVRTLTTCRPVVAVEISGTAAYAGLTPDTVRATILDHGYRFQARILADEVFVPSEWAA